MLYQTDLYGVLLRHDIHTSKCRKRSASPSLLHVASLAKITGVFVNMNDFAVHSDLVATVSVFADSGRVIVSN